MLPTHLYAQGLAHDSREKQLYVLVSMLHDRRSVEKPPLELQSQCCTEKSGDRRHLLARRNERRHESRAAHLRVGDLNGGSKIAQLQVIQKLVIAREAARRA